MRLNEITRRDLLKGAAGSVAAAAAPSSGAAPSSRADLPKARTLPSKINVWDFLKTHGVDSWNDDYQFTFEIPGDLMGIKEIQKVNIQLKIAESPQYAANLHVALNPAVTNFKGIEKKIEELVFSRLGVPEIWTNWVDVDMNETEMGSERLNNIYYEGSINFAKYIGREASRDIRRSLGDQATKALEVISPTSFEDDYDNDDDDIEYSSPIPVRRGNWEENPFWKENPFKPSTHQRSSIETDSPVVRDVQATVSKISTSQQVLKMFGTLLARLMGTAKVAPNDQEVAKLRNQLSTIFQQEHDKQQELGKDLQALPSLEDFNNSIDDLLTVKISKKPQEVPVPAAQDEIEDLRKNAGLKPR